MWHLDSFAARAARTEETSRSATCGDHGGPRTKRQITWTEYHRSVLQNQRRGQDAGARRPGGPTRRGQGHNDDTHPRAPGSIFDDDTRPGAPGSIFDSRGESRTCCSYPHFCFVADQNKLGEGGNMYLADGWLRVGDDGKFDD